MNIAVVMSTYNGQKYLREQLDSILAQAEVCVSIFVRDDGSTDETRNILTEYADKYSNVSVDFASNVGVGNSFMNALYSTPDGFDYYAFADQDDVWDKDKLISAVRLLQERGKMLYTSNQECVDKDGNSMGLRYESGRKINLLPEEIQNCNMVAGCTMVFNAELYGILTAQENRPSAELLYTRIHDVWVAFVAALNDGIIYDERSFIRYRQHENNVVGVKARKGERLKKLKNKKLRNGRSALAKESCRIFPELSSKFPLIEMSAKADTLSGKNTLISNINTIRAISGESKLGLLAKIFLGLY